MAKFYLYKNYTTNQSIKSGDLIFFWGGGGEVTSVLVWACEYEKD